MLRQHNHTVIAAATMCSDWICQPAPVRRRQEVNDASATDVSRPPNPQPPPPLHTGSCPHGAIDLRSRLNADLQCKQTSSCAISRLKMLGSFGVESGEDILKRRGGWINGEAQSRKLGEGQSGSRIRCGGGQSPRAMEINQGRIATGTGDGAAARKKHGGQRGCTHFLRLAWAWA